MPSEPEPPLHIFERNHLRLKFNIENICRKYEKIKESGVEVDLEEDAFYIDKNAQRVLINKTKQMYYTVGENWGLCPISAPFNNRDNLEGNDSLQRKCSKRDEEFNGDILAVTPYEPATHLTAKRKFREIINEETYTAEGLSIAELEDIIQKNGVTGKIVYRGIENNVAVIKIRHSTRSVVDERTNPNYEGENENDEVAREFASVQRKSLLEIQAPSTSTQLLAIEGPPTATENDNELVTPPESETLDEVALEFANVRRESLGLLPIEPPSHPTPPKSSIPAIENPVCEAISSKIQTPTTPKRMTPNRKRGSSSLEVSPKSKRSSQRSFARIDEFDDDLIKDGQKSSNSWNDETASSLYKRYTAASNKLRTVFGVDENDLEECEPSDFLIEFWVNSTVLWKTKAPNLFSCEFFKHEERRQFSAARERNHHLKFGFV